MTTESNSNDISKCPFHSGAKQVGVGGGGSTNRDWWPNRLHLNILRQHSSLSDPQDKDFNYVEEFKTLDYEGHTNYEKTYIWNSALHSFFA